ncbi:MAG: hypothetical protein ABI678_15990 [Kofleriaceae bacterium]
MHRLDAARLYCLAAERAHLGRKLGLPAVAKSPAEVAAHYGFLAASVGTDQPASSARTRELLGWQPREIGLLDDLDANGEPL